MKATTNRLTTKVAALLAGTLALTAGVVANAPVPGTPSPSHADGGGLQSNTVLVHVLHSQTGKPLANMPVYITPLEGATFVVRVDTDANGMAAYTGLPDGLYRVVVIWNNHSAGATVEMGSRDAPVMVTIYFNPDID